MLRHFKYISVRILGIEKVFQNAEVETVLEWQCLNNQTVVKQTFFCSMDCLFLKLGEMTKKIN